MNTFINKKGVVMDPLHPIRSMSAPSTNGDRQSNHSQVQQGKYVVPAIVISKPDLSLYTTIQNLLNYCLECVSSFVKESSDRKGLGEHFAECVNRIGALRTGRSAALDEETRRLLDEYIEDAGHVVNIIKTFIDNTEPDRTDITAQPQPAGILLAAKASHLQWLTVCLLEELRKPFNRT